MSRTVKPIPPQALPPEKRRPPAPEPFDETLPSGLRAQWRMPDPFAIIAFADTIPDPVTAGVIALLTEEKSYTPESDPLKLRRDSNAIRGMYGVAAAMLVTPTLDLSREYGDGITLGRSEIGYMDVAALYWRFRVGTRLAVAQSAPANDAGRPTDAAPNSE